MVSLNLAIFNLLPIPIMDGGTILMLLVEMIMRRDLSLNVKEAVFKVGFVCIMVMVAFVILQRHFQDPARGLKYAQMCRIFRCRPASSGKLIPACTVPASARPNCRTPRSLFADVLYHPDRTAPFIQHPFRDLERYQAAARQIEFSDGAPGGAGRRVAGAESA